MTLNPFFSCLKLRHFRGKMPKYVLTPQKKTGCHIFKLDIFSKFFVAVMTHKLTYDAGKRIKLFLIIFQLEILNILLSVF